MPEGLSLESFFSSSGLLSGLLARYEHRPSQAAMAKAVWQSYMDGVPLVVEAGTGTGKTFAYLIPALLSGRKTVVSTATKALQDQILDQDIPFLTRHFFPQARVCSLKGRKNYLCLRRFREFAHQPSFLNPHEAKLFGALHQWAAETKTGDRSELDWLPDHYQAWNEITAGAEQCLNQQCPHYGQCFVQKSRLQAAKADLLIVNHHLFFASLTMEDRGSGDFLSAFPAVIFDEAHHVEDVAGLFFGHQFSSWSVAELTRDVLRALAHAKVSADFRKNIASALEHLGRRTREAAKILSAAAGPLSMRQRLDLGAPTSPLPACAAALREALKNLGQLVQQQAGVSPLWESLEARCRALDWNLEQILGQEDPHLTHWYEVHNHPVGFTLRATPLDVAPILLEKLFHPKETVILTSATLATVESKRPSFHYIRERLGVPHEGRELQVPSPFAFEKQAALYIPKPFPFPHEPSFCQAMAREALKIMDKTQGRALFLFTSYRHMHETYRLLADQLPFLLLCQGEKPKRKLLSQFKEDTHSVLLATYSFWEGIDVPGHSLSCVLIDKLPFDVPNDPITASRVERLSQAGHNAFYRYQVPRAVLQLKQGFGRLIRSRQDKGVLVLFDTRVLTKPYGRIFLESLPAMPIVHRLDAIPEHLLSLKDLNSSNS
ncbi:ATP-dependent DNA helicase [Desulfosoma caldarium]|uniref:ATP-dependent DNA helicase DinG n=1 Tax=Desulfosoma caldarium TaxID=610254 RepID=A0A3N1VL18_9BACT|nr:helicase C-terminal domain-containing protein [Desulfosoma caldarium]ROR03494.1 ATP-dependent DNA helicase DinG [Desulfosoma caldarium]